MPLAPARPKLATWTCLACALAAAAAHGQSPAAVRPRMQAFVDRHEIAGAVTVIGRQDAILSHEAVGVLRLDDGQPMPKDALFRIASMTKPVTAIGIMILADEGKLAVTDPVEKHLPEFRGQMLIAGRTKDSVLLTQPSRPITIRDLLTHTSGLPGGYPAGMGDVYGKRTYTLAEATLVMAQRPLEFEPGTKWAYCNAGIDTLGRVIEVRSGRSFEEFLRERVFRPLGMTDTTSFPTAAQLDRAAPTYDRTDGKLVPAGTGLIGPPRNAKHPIPAGGLYSTGADLAKLYQMMLGKGTRNGVRILSPRSVAEMTRSHTGHLAAGFSPNMAFGLGWAVVQKPEGGPGALSPGSYGHGGAFGTQAWIDPHKDLFMILLIQRNGLPGGEAAKMVRGLQAAAVGLVGQ